ncbi:MAG: type IV pilus assembly protein PilM [Parcubacteria group bacterium]|nr:type IV pilus assembly protein PilM [Parcubacteria group bacterium]
MWPFSRKSRRQLGVDIGTSSVKIVELEKNDAGLGLFNYGIMDGSDFLGDANGSNTLTGLKMSEGDIALALKRLMSEAKIKTVDAVMSIPIFSSFITVMELPNLTQKELENAVPFEARSYIPVPLSEVVLDWFVIPPASPSSGQKADVLLIAVPKEIVTKYQRVAAAAGLNLTALESESFSLARILVGSDQGTVMLADLGARNSNLTIIDRAFIFMSHSADLSGKEITKVISRSLNIIPERAEELKKTSGVLSAGANQGLNQVVYPFIDKLVNEIERMNSLFFKKENKKVEKIILTGGAANLPGLTEYLSRHLGLAVMVGNAFSKIKFEPLLEQLLRRELSSGLAVAAGLAMRDL